MQFLYKDIVYKHKVESIDLSFDAIIETSSVTQFLINKPPERFFSLEIHLTLDNRNNEIFNMKQCNK